MEFNGYFQNNSVENLSNFCGLSENSSIVSQYNPNMILMNSIPDSSINNMGTELKISKFKNTADFTNQSIFNATKHPNYDFNQLIYKALEWAPNKALSVHEIVDWIVKTFPGFSSTASEWKKNLRETLSFGNFFVKSTSESKEHLKGLWIINPVEKERLIRSFYKNNCKDADQNYVSMPNNQSILPKHARQPRKSAVTSQFTNRIEDGETDTEVIIYKEKPIDDWSDTRLFTREVNNHLLLSTDVRSETSDTDHNDTARSILSQQPIYPVKNHQSQQSTPICSRDHEYTLAPTSVRSQHPDWPYEDDLASECFYGGPIDMSGNGLSGSVFAPPKRKYNKRKKVGESEPVHKSMGCVTGKKRGRPRKEMTQQRWRDLLASSGIQVPRKYTKRNKTFAQPLSDNKGSSVLSSLVGDIDEVVKEEDDEEAPDFTSQSAGSSIVSDKGPDGAEADELAPAVSGFNQRLDNLFNFSTFLDILES